MMRVIFVVVVMIVVVVVVVMVVVVLVVVVVVLEAFVWIVDQLWSMGAISRNGMYLLCGRRSLSSKKKSCDSNYKQVLYGTVLYALHCMMISWLQSYTTVCMCRSAQQ